MTSKDVSDERLNAFVDDELEASEKSEVFEALTEDRTLSQRACELRQLSELVRHAYNHPPPSERLQKEEAARQQRISPFGQAAAAALLIGLGATLGWIGHQQPEPEQASSGMNAMVWGDEDRAFHSADLAYRFLKGGYLFRAVTSPELVWSKGDAIWYPRRVSKLDGSLHYIPRCRTRRHSFHSVLLHSP